MTAIGVFAVIGVCAVAALAFYGVVRLIEG